MTHPDGLRVAKKPRLGETGTNTFLKTFLNCQSCCQDSRAPSVAMQMPSLWPGSFPLEESFVPQNCCWWSSSGGQ